MPRLRFVQNSDTPAAERACFCFQTMRFRPLIRVMQLLRILRPCKSMAPHLYSFTRILKLLRLRQELVAGSPSNGVLALEPVNRPS